MPEIAEVVARQRAFFRTGATRDLSFRLARLREVSFGGGCINDTLLRTATSCGG